MNLYVVASKELKLSGGSIETNINPDDRWSIVIKNVNYMDLGSTSEFYLTNGIRRIMIIQSPYNHKQINNPLSRYEYIEEGQVLAAVLYLGENIAWFREDLDHQMKLILASDMIAIQE